MESTRECLTRLVVEVSHTGHRRGPDARSGLLQPADIRSGGGVTEAENHLENARNLFRQTEPPLMAYSMIGLRPDSSSSFYLLRLIGIRRTQELMFTNRMLSADEALEWGLITKVVPALDVMKKVRKLADFLLDGPGQSNASIKTLLLQSFNN